MYSFFLIRIFFVDIYFSYEKEEFRLFEKYKSKKCKQNNISLYPKFIERKLENVQTKL